MRARFGEPTKDANFLDPNKAPQFPNDYRDRNTNWMVNGHKVELQINYPEMLEAKQINHVQYEKERDLLRKIKADQKAGKAPDPQDMERLKAVQTLQAEKIYGPAWNAAQARLKSASDTGSASLIKTPASIGRGPSGKVQVSAIPGGVNVQGRPEANPNFVPGGNEAGNRAGNLTTEPITSTSTGSIHQPEEIVMQNRDRSRRASIAQMASIVKNPDPERLGFSRDPNTGAGKHADVNSLRTGLQQAYGRSKIDRLEQAGLLKLVPRPTEMENLPPGVPARAQFLIC